jgi:hypothetical protein
MAHSSILRFCSSSSSTDFSITRPFSPGVMPFCTFVIRRSSDFILRNGQRLMPNLRHWRLSTVRPMPSLRHACSEGMWKQEARSSRVISDAHVRTRWRRSEAAAAAFSTAASSCERGSGGGKSGGA